MKPHNSTIAVKIDKAKQNDRRQKIGSLMLDPRYIFMRYNLQYGEIVMVGEEVKKTLPEIEVGDIALFHHGVEENSLSLIDELPNGDEICIVLPIPHVIDHTMANQLYGTIKPDGTIIPFDSYVFIGNEFESMEDKVESSVLSLTNIDSDSHEAIIERQDEATRYRKSLEMSFKGSESISQKEEILTEMNKIYQQQDLMVQVSNKSRRVYANVLHSSEKSKSLGILSESKVIVEKEMLYPLNIMGLSFYLIKNQYLDGVINGGPLTQSK